MTTKYTTNELDEQYVLQPQDPNDPVWETDANIAGMQNVDDPDDLYEESTPMIRAASGALHMLNDVVEEVHAFLELDEPVQTKPPKLDAIRTRELGSDTFRTRTATVTTAMAYPLVTKSDTRRRITLVNYGPDLVYISPMTAQAAAPNTVRLPVSSATFYAPICLQTRDDIWAECASGTGSTVEFIEEFDQES